jgi:predicted ABC-type exoprotein transport system permease subunit
MDAKKEGKINRIIIGTAAVIFLLLGVGVLIVEYIFFVEGHPGNVFAVVVFISSVVLYSILTFIVIRNRKRIFYFGEEDWEKF